MTADPMKFRVHERGDRRLDGILRLIEEAGRPRPPGEVLATLCAAIAEIARVDLVSVYVVEEGGRALVLRGNVGFPPGCVGNVRLEEGEGLTGFVAETLRPVSVAVARHDERYKHVPGIGEEEFLSYLAVPLLGRDGAAGVLVLQRKAPRDFAPTEVALAAALGAPVAYALERAHARELEREHERGAGSPPTTRTARLDGRGLGGGAALGRADVLPALDGIAEPRGGRPGHEVALALSGLARELGRAETRVAATLEPRVRRELRALTLLLEDLRLRDRVVAECGSSGVVKGLSAVAREYARAPYRLPGGADAGSWLAERAVEVEELCLLVAARAAGRLLPENGCVVISERLTGMLALAAVARRAVAVVVSGSVEECRFGSAIALAAGLPVVADVSALFAWARPGDRVLVDGGTGAVRINPPATVVARFRAAKSA
jgi:phosphotransferase system enzyme I (PtsP)